MKGKLIKIEDGYTLSIPNEATNNFIASTDGMYVEHILSLKNCEAIANGYDLEDLVDEYAEDWKYDERIGFRDGFKKALELLGDKKFSEEDISKAFVAGMQFIGEDKGSYNEFIESLQQTEWDVEIEMICPHPMDTYRCGLQYGCDEDGCNHPEQVPYLDADGCLILKRI